MKKVIEFLSSPMSVFIVPLIIITYILLSNMDVVLERFGFETRSHLKTELVKSKNTIDTLNETIKQLKMQQDKEMLHCDIKETITDNYVKESSSVDDYIKEVISNKDTTKINHGDTIKLEEKEPILEPDKNIVAINQVFDNLFGG